MSFESFKESAIRSFLVKIAREVLGATVVGPAFIAYDLYEIYSIFEPVSEIIGYVEAQNYCNAFPEGISVVSDYLGGEVADKLIKIGKDRFSVKKQASGIYIASQIVPKFRAVGLEQDLKIKRHFFSGNVKEIGGIPVKRGWLGNIKEIGGTPVKRGFFGNISEINRQPVKRGFFGNISEIDGVEIKRDFLGRIIEIGGKEVKRGFWGEIQEIGGQKLKRNFLSRSIKEIPKGCPEAVLLELIEEEERARERARKRNE